MSKSVIKWQKVAKKWHKKWHKKVQKYVYVIYEWPLRRLVQKQESYQRAILVGGVGSFSGSMNQSEDRTAQMLLIRQEAMEKSSARQGLLYRWTEHSAEFF